MSLLKYLCAVLIVLLSISQTILMPRNMLGITGINPFNIVVFVVFFIILLGTMLGHDKTRVVRKDFLYLYFFPLLLVAIIGTFNFHKTPAELMYLVNYDSSVGYFRDEFLKPILMVLAILLIGWVIEKKLNYRFYLHSFLASIFILSLLFVYSFIESGFDLGAYSDNEVRGKINETIGPHANDVGLLLSTTFCILLFAWGELKGKVKIYTFVIIILVMFSVALTFSRASLLGCVLVFVLYNLIKKNHILLVVLFGGLAPVLLWVFLNVDLGRINENVASGNVDDISSGRVELIWLPVIDEITNNPFIGNGLRSYNWSDAVSYGDAIPVGHPHNAYLQLVQDFGIVLGGIILIFYYRLYLLFSDVTRIVEVRYSGFFKGAKFSLFIVMFQGFFGGTFEISYMHSSIWIIAGVAIGICAYKKRYYKNNLAYNKVCFRDRKDS